MVREKRPRVKNIRIGLGIIGLISVVLGACGGGDATPTPTAAPATATPTRAAPTPVPTAAPTQAATAAPAAPTATPVRTATPVPTPTAVPATPPPPQATPKRGGSFAVRSAQGWPIRDTYDTRGAFSVNVTMPMMNSLITTNAYNYSDLTVLAPDLADRWDVNADGTVLTFALHKGVQWHDGKPFTSRDVAYSYNRAINPPAATVVAHKAAFSAVKSVETPDDNTVVLTMARPTVSFLQAIATAAVAIYPTHIPDMAVFSNAVVGTGAFKFKSGSPSTEAAMVRNEAYFRKDASGGALPYLDNVIVYFITDPATAFAAFRAGKYQLASGRDNDWLIDQKPRLNDTIPGLKSSPVGGGRVDLEFNFATPAMADPRVREAFHLAINRFEFAKLWSGGSENPIASPMVPFDLGGHWSLPKDELLANPAFKIENQAANLARAKELLKQAGYENKLQLRMVSHQVDFLKAMEVLNAQFRDAGITVTFRGLGDAERIPTMAQGNYDIAVISVGATFDDPAQHLANKLRTGAPQNFGKSSNPKIDQLLDDADRVFDEKARLAIIQDLQREILTQRPIVPIVWRLSANFWYKEVQNVPGCSFGLSPCQRWDQVWLDK